jgi:hypothetical protein
MAGKSKELCVLCSNNYYNYAAASGCWSFDSAKVVTRTLVGVWQNPPYKWNPQDTLSCCTPDGQRFISKDDPRVID